jgi:hypothetical protein
MDLLPAREEHTLAMVAKGKGMVGNTRIGQPIGWRGGGSLHAPRRALHATSRMIHTPVHGGPMVAQWWLG